MPYLSLKQSYKKLLWVIICASLLLGAGQGLTTALNNRTSPLIISEFVATGSTGLIDEDGDSSDWLEIYNQSSSPVNLSGWALTDDPNNLQKWTFPDISLDAGQYLVVFASGKDRKPATANPTLHTNFRLSQTGEFLALYNVLEQQIADSVAGQFPRQFKGISYGRLASQAGYFYFATPTPGQPNTSTPTWAGLVAEVQFSAKRGFYNAPFQLKLSTDTPDAAIRYTTDGSEPTATHGQTYSGPLLITTTTPVRAVALKTNYLPSASTTHTYIFLADVLAQPSHPPGFPATWGTHNETVLNYIKGAPVAADYEMDPNVVNDPRYRHTLKDDLLSIPTLSLVTDVKNLDIYAKPQERGRLWERPVSVELIYPDSPGQGFQINAGLRIHGGVGRYESVPKHSFRLFFRSEYGPAKLEYPLFPDSPVQTFNTLVLRAGTNRSYAGRYNSQHELTTYTRDEWARRTQLEMSGVSPRGMFVHLYFNGLYWGLYNLVERPDAEFFAAYLGGQPAQWYVRDQDGTVDGTANEAVLALSLAALKAGSAGFKDPQLYESVKTYLDTTQFSDYIILNWYAGNKDWPYNNWYAAARVPGGRLQFIEWDAENTFKNGAEIRLQGWTGGAPTLKAIDAMSEEQFRLEFEGNPIAYTFLALIANPDFQIEFADRVYEHLFNNGPLTDANTQTRWLELNNKIDRAIVGESARWGDTRREPPLTRDDDWLNARDAVLAQMEGNARKLVNLLRQAGFYPPLDPPAFSQQGGLISENFQLAMTAPTGQIYFTTDGADPRTPVTGHVAPTARQYDSPMSITTTTHLKARARTADGVWSALNQATFRRVAGHHKLRLTEIMYNPPNGDDYEFVELKNTGNTPVDLSGMSFAGIEFTFPANTNLAPGEFVVLARNPTAFAQRYPAVEIDGVYQGRLANSGERLALQNINGETVLSVEYSDAQGWPLSADGRGDSLVLIDPDGDPHNPKSWRASSHPHGSPGIDDNSRYLGP